MAPSHEQRNRTGALLLLLVLCTAISATAVLGDRPAFARGGGEGGGGGGGGAGEGGGGGGSGPSGGGGPGAGGHGAGTSGVGQKDQAPHAGGAMRSGVPGTGGRGPEAAHEFVGLFASQRAIEVAGQLGLEVEQRSLPTLGLTISRFRAASPVEAGTAQARLREVERSGGALFAPNSVYRPMAESCRDGGCGAAGLRHAAALSTDCRQPRSIGMVDTEVERSHPALRASPISVARFLPAATSVPAADGHGTAIAALLVGDPASRFPGIAPRTRLYAANVFFSGPENDVRASAFNLAEALEWLAEARPGVINLSLSGPPNVLLQAALARAIDLGIAVVAAAGNAGPGAPPAYPAAYDRVIAVTAVDEEQRPYRWANQGDYIQFAAPGVDLWTADLGGSGKRRSGTSLAAALFAGLVAGAAPARARRADDVAAWARRHAVDLGPPGRDPVFGWGFVRIDAACSD